ncbi:phospho-sugar mutase [Olsenella sp. TM06-36]|jgi:phosphoglucomutase|uniref:Phospho-sugar mutase n=1 Tax=Tractidigestivibacter montrealensis TaxID=2972466 RepID=A0ABT1ZAW3_9ACTN|nr:MULTISPECIES: phospho-sugar mutase [Atopobiaceae]MCR9037348.1 phospho-sugar mutase [Tractidigestivibacter montrealensis]RGJ46776.1 phospho-sugar mutase [Olsenella sp. TM06-36]
MDAGVKETIKLWQDNVTEPDLKAELDALVSAGDEDALNDAFYRTLEFGTAGLRGTLGVGTNRMNVYVVAQATQGVANYLNAHYDHPTIAIARDSRLKGEDFQRVAAGVLAANGVHVYVYPRIEPVPTLSFAVRYLHTSAGIVLTASHNPAQYNGYKVYNDNGGQIANEAADEISASIAQTPVFGGVKMMDFDEGLKQGLIEWTPEEVLDAFIDAVKKVSVPGFKAPEGYKVVYTPLNGTGMECVTRILKEIGVNDVTVVPEQANPDGNFPTCKYPNPEFREALQMALDLAEKVKPNLVVATDPDADRMGTAIPHNGEYKLLTGNEMGVLMMDWLIKMAIDRGEDPKRKVAVSTIVSSVMPDALAKHYGFEMRRVLTGFKYIGDQIDQLKDEGEEDRFLMGFEESYGYLVGTHARDKDAIVAVEMCVEMAAYYAERGMDLYEAMEELYKQYGYYLNGTVNAQFPGEAGAKRMAQIMTGLRENPLTEIGGYKVVGMTDFGKGAEMPRVSGLQKEPAQELPAANVIEYRLEDDNKVIFRPSGTEPKVKAYLFAKGATRAEAEAVRAKLQAAAEKALS